MKAIKEFENFGFLDWRLNCTNIILIPECDGIVCVNQYRPIKLIGGVYKIILKLSSNRLKLILPSLITDFQGAFVDGRQITDRILIAAELIDASERSQIPRIAVKADLEKGFDNLNWKCLDVIMQRFGFGNVWRN